jgi:hypothetical protein
MHNDGPRPVQFPEGVRVEFRTPKDDIPRYNAEARRKIEAVFGPEYPPVESRWWFGPLTWAIALAAFPFILAIHVLTRPKGGRSETAL